jgi:ribosomal protein L11 methyltransferase
MPDQFYQFSIIQPGDLPPRVIDFWLDLDIPGLISATATRLGPHETGDWRFAWILDHDWPLLDWQKFLHANWGTILDGSLAFVPPSMTREVVADQDWLTMCYRGFPPQIVGRFFIRGTHDQDQPSPDHLIPITLDAATAFGSGEHGTTRGCLWALGHLVDQNFTPRTILDLGTGSGILAIAAHQLWPTATVHAVDNDPEAVRVARVYANLNNAGTIICFEGDAPKNGPYDLIIANILAGPLKTLAPAIAAALSPHGQLILSGLLQDQQDDVATAYQKHGLTLTHTIPMDDWVTLQFRAAV